MKSRTISHPSGVSFQTPLLIPSFSSKGFALQNQKVGKKLRKVSELYKVLEVPVQEILHESLLVSAYDIYYGLIPSLKEIRCTEIVFLDSGGYETSEAYDLSGINKTRHEILEWDEGKLIETLSSCPEEMNLVAVNFDHGNTRVNFSEQIERARNYFEAHCEGMITDFLIKPEKKEQGNVVISDLLKYIHELRHFDIIGLTEKELGNSIHDRMINIKTVRNALDDHNLEDKAIHIFGSLDPLTSVLYFFAGAEIFDGLTWLKFSYYQGMAIYNHNFSALSENLGVNTKNSTVGISSLFSNVGYLEKLKFSMMDFYSNRSFDSFDYLKNDDVIKVFKECYNRLIK